MSMEVEEEMLRLSQTLKETELQVLRAFANDEMLEELAARGVSRKALSELVGALADVKRGFYATPQPV